MRPRPLPGALLLTLLAPALALAQGRAAAPATIDTLQSEITGIPSAPGGVFRGTIVRRREVRPAAGANVLLRTSDVTQRDADGRNQLRNRERIEVDARTFAFRRSTNRTEQANGELVVESAREVVDGRLRTIVHTPSHTDTLWSALPADGQVLFGSMDDAITRAPGALTPGSARHVMIPTPPFHTRLVFDSVSLPATDGTARLWAHLDSAGVRQAVMEAVLDTTTREIARMRWQRTEGIVSTTTNLSMQRRTAVATAPASRPASGGGASARALAGRYRLEGEREMASEIVLRPDGRFAYALAYGALDEEGAGQWRVDDGAVVLQSDGAAHEPSVRLREATGASGDSVVIVVTDTAGAPVDGIEVDVVQPRTGTSFAHARRGRHVVRYAKGDAPTEISVGYDIVDFMVRFPITGKPKGTYRFTFDRGDLGRYRFEEARLAIEGDVLVLVRNGHRMRYRRG